LVVTTRIGDPPPPSVVEMRSLTRPLIVTVIGSRRPSAHWSCRTAVSHLPSACL